MNGGIAGIVLQIMGMETTGASSIWTVIASIFIGCMILMSLCLLFVKASNIERRWLVSVSTVLSCGLALFLMVSDSQFVPGRELPTSIAAMTLSLLGFFIGRAIDVSLGERDRAVLQTELAD